MLFRCHDAHTHTRTHTHTTTRTRTHTRARVKIPSGLSCRESHSPFQASGAQNFHSPGRIFHQPQVRWCEITLRSQNLELGRGGSSYRVCGPAPSLRPPQSRCRSRCPRLPSPGALPGPATQLQTRTHVSGETRRVAVFLHHAVPSLAADSKKPALLL